MSISRPGPSACRAQTRYYRERNTSITVPPRRVRRAAGEQGRRRSRSGGAPPASGFFRLVSSSAPNAGRYGSRNSAAARNFEPGQIAELPFGVHQSAARAPKWRPSFGSRPVCVKPSNLLALSRPRRKGLGAMDLKLKGRRPMHCEDVPLAAIAAAVGTRSTSIDGTMVRTTR